MEYIIGSGTALEAGPPATLAPIALHAHVDAPASQVRAAVIDLEGTSAADVRKLLVVVQGAARSFIVRRIEAPLRARRECSLADVICTLARAAEVDEVHLFAHWLPREQDARELAGTGITVVAHPVESIRAASVVSGQRYERVA